MLALKLTQIGNSVGFVLPKEAASRLNVEKGDMVYLAHALTLLRLSSSTVRHVMAAIPPNHEALFATIGGIIARGRQSYRAQSGRSTRACSFIQPDYSWVRTGSTR